MHFAKHRLNESVGTMANTTEAPGVGRQVLCVCPELIVQSVHLHKEIANRIQLDLPLCETQALLFSRQANQTHNSGH